MLLTSSLSKSSCLGARVRHSAAERRKRVAGVSTAPPSLRSLRRTIHHPEVASLALIATVLVSLPWDDSKLACCRPSHPDTTIARRTRRARRRVPCECLLG